MRLRVPSNIVYCVRRVLLSHKALRDYPIVIIRRKLLNVIPKQVASFGDKKQHSTFNHLLNSEMGSHWRKGEICGVDNCRSRLYTVDENDGYQYCENGHRRGVSHLTSEVKSVNCSNISNCRDRIRLLLEKMKISLIHTPKDYAKNQLMKQRRPINVGHFLKIVLQSLQS